MVANLSYSENRHPWPDDPGVYGVYKDQGRLFAQDGRAIALLAWASFTLREHMKQGFRGMDDEVASYFRVPDRGSVNPTPLGGGEYCVWAKTGSVCAWNTTNAEATRSGT